MALDQIDWGKVSERWANHPIKIVGVKPLNRESIDVLFSEPLDPFHACLCIAEVFEQCGGKAGTVKEGNHYSVRLEREGEAYFSAHPNSLLHQTKNRHYQFMLDQGNPEVIHPLVA